MKSAVQLSPGINDAIHARNKPGLYKDILKARCRIRFAMNDEYWQAKPAPVDAEFFALAKKFDGFVTPITPEGLHRLEAQTGCRSPSRRSEARDGKDFNSRSR